MTGRLVSHYKVLDKLGDGGMGSVYRGLDTMLDRKVAIKVLHAHVASQPGVVERFRSEATLLARLNHANIATLYSFFREGDEFFMVMELIDGVPISDWVRRYGLVTPRRATELMSQVLAGLEHAHQLGVVHRDIKPANLLVTEQGAVKITDFGIGRAVGSERLTREARLVGTMEYLAPERIKGEAGDARSDLYSAGIVLYELLANRIPFERNSDFELMRAHLEDQPTPVRTLSMQVPEQLEALVHRALAKRPEDRFATAGEMGIALAAVDWASFPETALEGSGVKGTRMVDVPVAQTRYVEPAPTPTSKSRLPAGSKTWIGLACAALLLLVVLLLARRADSPHRPNTADTEVTAPAVRQSVAPPAVAAPASGAADMVVPAASQDAAGSDADNPAEKRKEAAKARRRAAALRALDQ